MTLLEAYAKGFRVVMPYVARLLIGIYAVEGWIVLYPELGPWWSVAVIVEVAIGLYFIYAVKERAV